MKGYVDINKAKNNSLQKVKAIKYKFDVASEGCKVCAFMAFKCKSDNFMSYLIKLNTQPKTLFIDANIYDSKIAGNLALENVGLSQVLNGEADIASVIQKIDENTEVICSGSGLNSLDINGLSDIINKLKTKYDKIIINGPQYTNIADCIKIAQMVDASFLQFAIGLSKRKISECLNSFEVAGVNIKGCFLSEN